jgi:uncharacterized protein involved in exopolysaccharide biosynthesis/Mrp family chromosome partitioning ATPase
MQNEMKNHQAPEQGTGISLEQVYYALFRHKLLIILFTILGLAGAGGVFLIKGKLYQSEAALLVNYVAQSKSVKTVGSEAQYKSPDERGDTIINTEIQVLQSRDLMDRVVKMVGADKILTGSGGGNNPQEAALAIAQNLKIAYQPKSSVVRVTFEHPNKAVARDVLSALTDEYLKLYLEIHRSAGQTENLDKETKRYRESVKTTQAELQRLLSEADVTSLEDSKKGIEAEMSQLRFELNSAKAEVAQRQAALGQIEPTKKEKDPAEKPASPEQLKRSADYRDLVRRLEALKARENELTTTLTDENPKVKNIHEQIAGIEIKKRALETEDPELARMPVTPYTGSDKSTFDAFGEKLRVAGLLARIASLESSSSNLAVRASTLQKRELDIRDVQRQYEVQEANYKAFSAALEQSRLDASLNPGNLQDIQVFQKATPAERKFKELFKAMGMALAAGVGAGLGLAFLLEMVIDQTVKRPVELETRLRLPVFLSIPKVRSSRRTLGNGSATANLLKNGNGELKPDGESGGIPGSGHESDELCPFYGALRDRVITYLERMTHKPKLVAVTGANAGAGTTSIATGLAAALSETAEGRVLLVDMNQRPGTVHPFLNGQAVQGLSEVLENQNRETAQVQENLYMVSANNQRERRLPVFPRQFANLIPKLKASDYDYVIFDMPPVNPTSTTPRLAGLMDLVLLVVESEKTNREVVQRAANLLLEVKGNVATVLNKRRSYIPAWLHEEV